MCTNAKLLVDVRPRSTVAAAPVDLDSGLRRSSDDAASVHYDLDVRVERELVAQVIIEAQIVTGDDEEVSG